ncbi:MAG: hypothetical protein JWM47_883 [Acidimicrobiales bacterium]|nr:hypothetical protein [Acidimicrobiales bacterium]
MINFRYHIVSITAVFLALGIGTALGSTFLSGTTVDLLNRNIRSAEARIEETRTENRRLSQIDEEARARDLALLLDGSDRLVGDLLVDRPVLVVLGPGVDDGLANGVRRMIEATGADLRATLVLRDPMLFDGALDDELARSMGVEARNTAALERAVHDEVTAALAAAGAPAASGGTDGQGSGATTSTTVPGTATTPTTATTATSTTVPAPTTVPSTVPGGTVTTTTAPEGDDEAKGPDGSQPEIIDLLLDRGYLTVEPADGHAADDPILETAGYSYVIVTGEGASAAQTEVLADLLPTGSLAEALPAIIVGATPPEEVPDGEAPHDLVTRIRDDVEFRSFYGTVDDIEAFSGLVAMVLSLDDLRSVPPGHYGQGPGAKSTLPSSP